MIRIFRIKNKELQNERVKEKERPSALFFFDGALSEILRGFVRSRMIHGTGQIRVSWIHLSVQNFSAAGRPVRLIRGLCGIFSEAVQFQAFCALGTFSPYVFFLADDKIDPGLVGDLCRLDGKYAAVLGFFNPELALDISVFRTYRKAVVEPLIG